MSNPFKKITHNAASSKSETQHRGVRIETSVASRTCDCCGAPRPKKSNLVKCDYCKTPFMERVQNLKADS